MKWRNEKRKIKELIPYVANPRQITDKQAKDLKESLRRFGVADPIIINTDNTIIGGHQRKKVLEDLLNYDPDHEIDVRVPERELTIDEVRELNVRLNKNVAEFDFDILANNFELDDLLEWGFEERELDLNLWLDEPPEDAEPQFDKAEELCEKWGVETGQLWKLGEHRLICGDCTDEAVVEHLFDISPEICVTDPPYGVSYNPQWRVDMAEAGHLAYAARRVGVVTNDDRADWSDAWRLFPGDVIYTWHPPGATSLVHAHALQDSGFQIRIQIIWAKSNFPIGRGDYHVRHEPCWYAVREGQPARRTDDRTQTTLWEINLDKNVEGGHSTQKPLECMARPIRNHEFDVVYDPFLGSGTTLIACEQLSRRCRAVEISPAYVAVAIQRWVDVTGGEPELLP